MLLAAWKETQNKREDGGRWRDEKRELKKKYHLFYRNIEDDDVSRAMKQNGRIESGCERSPLTGGESGHQRGKTGRSDKRQADRWKTGR